MTRLQLHCTQQVALPGSQAQRTGSLEFQCDLLRKHLVAAAVACQVQAALGNGLALLAALALAHCLQLEAVLLGQEAVPVLHHAGALQSSMRDGVSVVEAAQGIVIVSTVDKPPA